LTAAAADTPDGEGGYGEMAEETEAAVIADVATNAGLGIVLEVGVGRINEIYVIAPLVEEDGTTTLQVTKGGVFSYYEFAWPMRDRLTDEKWRQMLDEGKSPQLPVWTARFFNPESGYDALRDAVYRFHESLVAAFWLVDASELSGGDALRAQLGPEIADLEAEGRCQRRLLVGSTPRSIDLQSEDKAVVTMRETWEDALHTFEPGWCYGHEEDPLARRGPYTLDVTYTLERIEGGWQVTRVVYADQPPGWE